MNRIAQATHYRRAVSLLRELDRMPWYRKLWEWHRVKAFLKDVNKESK